MPSTFIKLDGMKFELSARFYLFAFDTNKERNNYNYENSCCINKSEVSFAFKYVIAWTQKLLRRANNAFLNS